LPLETAGDLLVVPHRARVERGGRMEMCRQHVGPDRDRLEVRRQRDRYRERADGKTREPRGSARVREEREPERRRERHREALRDARRTLSESEPVDREQDRPARCEAERPAARADREQHRRKERDDEIVLVEERDDERQRAAGDRDAFFVGAAPRGSDCEDESDEADGESHDLRDLTVRAELPCDRDRRLLDREKPFAGAVFAQQREIAQKACAAVRRRRQCEECR